MAISLSVLLLLFANLELASTFTISASPNEPILGNSVYFWVRYNPWRNSFIIWRVNSTTLIVKAEGGNVMYSPSYEHRARLFISTAALRLENVTPKDSGIYQVEIVDTTIGVQSTAEITLRVHTRISNVKVSISPISSGFVEDEDYVTLKCAANGTSPIYSWSFARKPLPDNPRYTLSTDHSSLTIRPVKRTDSGEFVCIVKNTVSRAHGKAVNLQISRSPSGQIICDVEDRGNQLELSCSWAAGLPQTAIELKVGSISLTGSNRPRYTIEKKDINPSMELQCTGQHLIATQTCRLALVEPQLSVLSNPQLKVALNASVTLQVSLTKGLRHSATELLAVKFTWSKGNNLITESDNRFIVTSNRTFSQLIIRNFDKADEGKYTCVAKNAIGEKVLDFFLDLLVSVSGGVIAGIILAINVPIAGVASVGAVCYKWKCKM